MPHARFDASLATPSRTGRGLGRGFGARLPSSSAWLAGFIEVLEALLIGSLGRRLTNIRVPRFAAMDELTRNVRSYFATGGIWHRAAEPRTSIRCLRRA